MKLKELIEIVKLTKKEDVYMDNTLYGKNLEKYKDIIMNTDEFKECESLEIIEYPIVKSRNGEGLKPYTIKLSDLMKFKGKCYLLSLNLTPEMYDPNQLLKPVKNGAAMGPAIYDPSTFEPRKHILLTWSPEMSQDISGVNDELTLRNDIHKLLDESDINNIRVKMQTRLLSLEDVVNSLEIVKKQGQPKPPKTNVNLSQYAPDKVDGKEVIYNELPKCLIKKKKFKMKL